MHTSCVTVAGKRARFKRRRRAAVDIQRLYRGHCARRARRVLNKMAAVEARKLKLEYLRRRNEEAFRREGAALRIQQCYRARNARLETRKRISMHKSEAARKLQRVMRARLAVRAARRRRRRAERREAAALAATCRLQVWARGCLARKTRRVLTMTKAVREKRRQDMRSERLVPPASQPASQPATFCQPRFASQPATFCQPASQPATCLTTQARVYS
jgi:ATP-dependent exoDNAse (exonuclease V) alpha subunit